MLANALQHKYEFRRARINSRHCQILHLEGLTLKKLARLEHDLVGRPDQQVPGFGPGRLSSTAACAG